MSAFELLIRQVLVQRLGWTLLHFVWQGAVAAALLALLLPALRSASVRYVAAGLTLLAMAAAVKEAGKHVEFKFDMPLKIVVSASIGER